jgi:hypothetical protein
MEYSAKARLPLPNWYKASLIFLLQKGEKIGPKGENLRPLKILRFWRLMPKGRIYWPKAKGPHHHFQKLFHKKEEIVSIGIVFKGEEIISIAKTLLTAKGRTSSGGAFI